MRLQFSGWLQITKHDLLVAFIVSPPCLVCLKKETEKLKYYHAISNL